MIDLSNYRGKSFNAVTLKSFLDSIPDMRCLNSLILQNNGINDQYIDEIESIFFNINIKKIDLSRNEIGKQGGTFIGNMMKQVINHIEWMDLSRNCFHTNFQCVNAIYQGLRN